MLTMFKVRKHAGVNNNFPLNFGEKFLKIFQFWKKMQMLFEVT